MTSKTEEFIKGDRFVFPFFEIKTTKFKKTGQIIRPYDRRISSMFSSAPRGFAYSFCKYNLGLKKEWESLLEAIADNLPYNDQAEVNSFGEWLLSKMEDPSRSPRQKKHISIVLREVADRVDKALGTRIMAELVLNDL